MVRALVDPEKGKLVTALDQLAARCGIQESSVDVFGKEHKATPELKQAILKAMHFKADDEAQAEASLAELNAREWERPLPPVLVAYQESQGDQDRPQLSVPLVLPRETRTVTWSLVLEDGSERSGEVDFAALSLDEERERDGAPRQHRTLLLEEQLPWGYHTLRVTPGEGEMSLILTPGRCWLPSDEGDRRLWGIAANLYLLRSGHNWGIGDYTDLRSLVTLARQHGADAIGLNPLHAMFLDKPGDASPYSPSDRVLLNVLNIDVEAVPEFAQSEQAQRLVSSADFQAKLAASRNAGHVDYVAAAELKLAALRLLFLTFEQAADPARVDALEAFQAERRELLDRACLFQAMRAFFTAQTPSLSDCKDWPEEYRNLNSPAVARFAREQARLVRFHLWLQWIADAQLKAAADAAKGMAVGLYRDLAVGAHPSGAEVWSHPDELVSGAQVGAPPDILSPSGQSWGLPPLHPIAAREHGYRSFIELVRSNMRYAGGLRIDHAMALQRLYWIPQGMDPKDGGYVTYPMDDLIGILALESQRNRCLVVGEDLGTVPEGFRERSAKANILSYRVLFFEVEEDTFIPPDQYPRLGLSVASNHDLATLRGWWQGSDLDLKHRLDLLPDGPDAVREERARSRESLISAFREQGLLDEQEKVTLDQYAEAAHRFLGRTRCLLTLVQIDDILGEPDQVNLPGTTDQYPNWRRRLSVTLEDLASDPRFERTANLLKQEREADTESQPAAVPARAFHLV